ncbi:hypothetical protein EVAR_48962_1 [Eumeta japonica]|uniref:Uncharacterized protein n=1 Tax=Eumeta variegata TaxID=151549 RepID=A0A4C1Y7S3_EUMVA|nr:hypothetical protein EVAR_48962_1 [Eumeta japonica]
MAIAPSGRRGRYFRGPCPRVRGSVLEFPVITAGDAPRGCWPESIRRTAAAAAAGHGIDGLVLARSVDIIFPFGGFIFLCGLSGEGVTGGRHPSPQGGAPGARAARLSTESSPARDHPYRGSVSGQESRKPPAPRRDSGSSYARQLEAITMLIGLVRDSVLQCFCHSCRAPVLPAGF